MVVNVHLLQSSLASSHSLFQSFLWTYQKQQQSQASRQTFCPLFYLSSVKTMSFLKSFEFWILTSLMLPLCCLWECPIPYIPQEEKTTAFFLRSLLHWTDCLDFLETESGDGCSHESSWRGSACAGIDARKKGAWWGCHIVTNGHLLQHKARVPRLHAWTWSSAHISVWHLWRSSSCAFTCCQAPITLVCG